jgi:hypothetical protein
MFECSKRHYQPLIVLDFAHRGLSAEKASDQNNPYGSIFANMPPEKELKADQPKQIVSKLLLLVKEGELEQKMVRGALTEVAKNFNVTAQMVRKIWKRVRQPQILGLHNGRFGPTQQPTTKRTR